MGTDTSVIPGRSKVGPMLGNRPPVRRRRERLETLEVKGLTAAARGLLGVDLTVRRGELVVEQGRKSNALFILLNGRARVLTADTRGREVILAVLEAGDYVGEMSLIDNQPHSATVRCEVQTDMLILGRPDFQRCLPEHSSLSYAILRGLVRRLRHADRQIESLALLDVYGRVARTLLDMAEDVGGQQIIRGKVSRQDLAKVVGASREMVSRVMKDLEERGIVETQENGSVLIKNGLG